MNNTPPQRRKKKKRRLRKQVKIALYCIGIFLCVLLVWGISTMISSCSRSGNDQEKQVETQTNTNTDSDNTSNSSSSSNSDAKTGLTTYPDENKEKVTVMLDAGHGDGDPGNVMTDIETGEQYLEKEINLKLVRLIGKKLQETNPNLEILYTRQSDDINFTSIEDDLNWRVDEQTDQTGGEPVDYFVSIHCNASAVDSTITGYNFFVKPDDKVMHDMADEIADKLEAQNWSQNNGTVDTVGSNRLQIISFSPTHAMLIETGYMTNDEELTNLLDPKIQDKIANAIAAGISDYIMANPDSAAIESPAQVFEDVEEAKKNHANETVRQDQESEDNSEDSTSDSSSDQVQYDPYTGLPIEDDTDNSSDPAGIQYDAYGNPITQ